jgi:NAD(P)-dependent dehydrogenase (short-subunit alcohol dehydrogenase family)
MSKRLIITGASRGIGKAIATRFASEGFDIVFCSLNPQTLGEFEQFLTTEKGIRAKGLVCDLRDKAQVMKFGKDALDFLGGCDVLVNNAGVFVPGSVELDADGVFEDQMAVNINAYYHLTRAALPALKQGNRPHIFNMCSIASIKAYPNGGSYCISKYAALGLTRVLREELKPAGVAVTAVMPGATLTESWGGTDYPESRFMATKDIAEALWAAYSINEHTVVEDLVMRPVAGDI